jgi:hypothetical protein
LSAGSSCALPAEAVQLGDEVGEARADWYSPVNPPAAGGELEEFVSPCRLEQRQVFKRMASRQAMRYPRHVNFPFAYREVDFFASAGSANPAEVSFSVHDLGSIWGRLSIHRRRSSARIKLRRPRLSARRAPERIAS